MPWVQKESTPEQIAREVKMNIEDKNDNARLLILGTETPQGYTMRMTLKHPEAIAGIIYNHAIKTGEIDHALQMSMHLELIGKTAKKLIEDELGRRKKAN